MKISEIDQIYIVEIWRWIRVRNLYFKESVEMEGFIEVDKAEKWVMENLIKKYNLKIKDSSYDRCYKIDTNNLNFDFIAELDYYFDDVDLDYDNFEIRIIPLGLNN